MLRSANLGHHRTWLRLRQAVSGAPGALLVRIGGRILSLVVTIVVTRLLGVSNYGVYVYALAWATLLTLPTTIGLDRLLVRYVARYEAHGDKRLLAGLVRAADLLIIGLSAVAVAIASVLVAMAASPTYVVALFIILPLIPVQSLMQVAQSIIQGLHHAEQSQIPAFLIAPCVFVVLLLAFAATGISVNASIALLLNVAAAVAALLAATVMRRIHLRPLIVDVGRRGYDLAQWKGGMAPLAVVGLLSNANSQVGLLMLGWFGNSADIGVFAAALKVAQVVFLANAAINAALAPRVARFQALDDMDSIRGAARRASRFNSAFAIPLGAAFLIFQGPLLSIFGSGFAVGGTALTILICAQMLNAVTGSVGIILLMTGHGRQAAIGLGLGLLVDVVLCATLIPPLGAIGAAIAAGADMLTWNVILAVIAWRLLKVNTTAFGSIGWRAAAAENRT